MTEHREDLAPEERADETAEEPTAADRTGPRPRPVDRPSAPPGESTADTDAVVETGRPAGEERKGTAPPPPPPPAAGPRPRPGPGSSLELRPRPSPEPRPEATVRSAPRSASSEEPDRSEDPLLVGSVLDGSYGDVVRKVERLVADGYDLLGVVGVTEAGKTHALRALTYLLDGFSAEARNILLEQLAPAPTGLSIHALPYEGSGPEDRDRAVFVDAGGELFVRLQENDWSVSAANTALLHALAEAKGLFCMVDLHPGHFDDPGTWQGMGRSAAAKADKAREAQAEQQLVDLTLLFLRAIRHHGDVRPVIREAAEAPSTEEALQRYRTLAPRLDIPVTVLFTKADQWVGNDYPLSHGERLAPHTTLLGVTPFVHRRLPYLYNAVAGQCRRFRFDFVQSYVEAERTRHGETRVQPEWKWNDHPLSVGLLPAVEFVLRNRPPEGRLPQLLRRFEIDTGTAHRLHRWRHPQLWERGGP